MVSDWWPFSTKPFFLAGLFIHFLHRALTKLSKIYWLNIFLPLGGFTFDSFSSGSWGVDLLFWENILASLFFLMCIWVVLRKIGERNIFLTDIYFCEQSTSISFWALVMNGPKAFSATSGVSSKCPWANGRSNVFSLRVVTFGIVWLLTAAWELPACHLWWAYRHSEKHCPLA